MKIKAWWRNGDSPAAFRFGKCVVEFGSTGWLPLGVRSIISTRLVSVWLDRARYVIQYAEPRPGKRMNWVIFETDSLARITARALKVHDRGWQNRAGFEGGFYDRNESRFIRSED